MELMNTCRANRLFIYLFIFLLAERMVAAIRESGCRGALDPPDWDFFLSVPGM